MRLTRRRARGDRGSLPMVMLVMMIGVGLSAVIVPTLLRQDSSTRTDNYRNAQLGAAESGIDVLLGQIRTSTDVSGSGVTAKLPCAPEPSATDTDGAPLTGSVDGAGLGYSVTATYYLQDPTDWDDPAGNNYHPDYYAVYDPTNAPNGHGMLCQNGYGTFLPAAPTGPSWNTAAATTASYVRITSTGSDGHGSRTLRAIYKVQTTNANVAGGTIYVYPSGSTNYCMDATSATPTAGTQVLLKSCLGATVPRQQQLWAYRTDLSIQLVSSVGSPLANGLCLTDDAVYRGTSVPAEAANDLITLQPCAVEGNSPWYQQWSVNGSAYLVGAKPPSPLAATAGSDVNGLCIHITSQAASIPLKLAACPSSGSVTDVNNTWVESADVGPGSAGADLGDVVNFLLFGKCLDVTNQRTNGTWVPPASTGDGSTAGGNNYLIAYTCKQNPQKKLDWNQVFTYQASQGRWITCSGAAQGTTLSQCASSSQYCLSSPASSTLTSNTETQVPTKSGTNWILPPYVTVIPCSSCPGGSTHLNVGDSCMWKQYGATDANGNQYAANLKYTIQDSYQNCLDVGTNSADFHVLQYPKVIVSKCTGVKQQEWNGLPDIQTPIVQGYQEIANPTS